MNKAIAKKWAAALRSGKYRQGKGCLKQTATDGTVSHCCLGVLIELYQAAMRRQGKRALKETTLAEPIMTNVSGKSVYITGASYFSSRTAGDEYAELPPEVMEWAEISAPVCKYPGPGYETESRDLADDNDLGKSFRQIARTIEHYAEDL